MLPVLTCYPMSVACYVSSKRFCIGEYQLTKLKLHACRCRSKWRRRRCWCDAMQWRLPHCWDWWRLPPTTCSSTPTAAPGHRQAKGRCVLYHATWMDAFIRCSLQHQRQRHLAQGRIFECTEHVGLMCVCPGCCRSAAAARQSCGGSTRRGVCYGSGASWRAPPGLQPAATALNSHGCARTSTHMRRSTAFSAGALSVQSSHLLTSTVHSPHLSRSRASPVQETLLLASRLA